MKGSIVMMVIGALIVVMMAILLTQSISDVQEVQAIASYTSYVHEARQLWLAGQTPPSTDIPLPKGYKIHVQGSKVTLYYNNKVLRSSTLTFLGLSPNYVYDNGKYGIGPWGRRVNGWPDPTAGWIWTKKSTSAVPPGSVTLTKFVNSTGGAFTFFTAVDNSFKLYVNGAEILSGNRWTQTYKTTYSLSAGTHTIKIIATNAGTSPNPAGVLFAMYSSTGKLILQSDGTWTYID